MSLDSRSSSLHHMNQESSLVSTMDFQPLPKTLNFNLPIKLDKLNYVNWKAQVSAAIRALELEDFITESRSMPGQVIEELDENGVVKETLINPEYRSWKRADQLLLCWLLSTIGKEVLG